MAASRVEGVKEAAAALRRIRTGIPKVKRNILTEIALTGERFGKQKIRDEDRIDTGRMLSAYAGRVRKLSVELTSPLPYFRFQDLGTKHVPAANVSEWVFSRLRPMIPQIVSKHVRRLVSGRL